MSLIICPRCHFENSSDTRHCGFCDLQLLDDAGGETVFEGTVLQSGPPDTESADTDVTRLENPTSIAENETRFVTQDAAQAPPDKSGFNLAGNLAHFAVQQIIGKGGMGAVYRATDETLERNVAIKVLRQNKGLDQTGRDLLLEEARTICKLSHPNIVTVYDIARGKDNNFIIMEWIDGKTLDKLISPDGLALDTALNYAHQIVRGLVHAHQNNIIHSDIKPQNIMLTGDAGIKILDFGIAGLFQNQVNYSEEELRPDNSDSHFYGTPGYMSPEQALGKKQLDQRSDIFAFGILFYQMLSGKRPFEGKTVKEKIAAIITGDHPPLPARIPLDIRAIVEHCLSLSAKDRYQTSEELEVDLNRYFSGQPVRVINSKSYWLKKKTLKHKWPVMLLVLLSLGGTGQLIWQQLQRAQQAEREELLTRFTGRVETLEARVHMSKMAPIHDTSEELEAWHSEIDTIKKEIALLGEMATGPGNHAIGRMYYALQDYDQALLHLQLAWNSGFTEPEVAYNLALTHGALYQKQKSIIDNLTSRSARKDRMAELDRQHKQPAIEYLNQGADGSPYQSFTTAQLAYFQGEYDKALKTLENATDLPIWFYQHHVLTGDIYLAKAQDESGDHGNQKVQEFSQLALQSYQKAADLGRSDLQLQLKPMTVYFRLLTESLYGAQQYFEEIYQQATQYVANAMQIAPKSYQPYFMKGQLLSHKSAYEDQTSGDPIATETLAIEQLSKARKLSGENPDVLFSLGHAYFQKIKLLQDREFNVGKEFDSAIKAFEAIPEENRDYFYFNSYGNLLSEFAVHKAKQHQEALINNILTGNTSHSNLDTNSDIDNLFVLSIDTYKKASELQPTRIGARINKASVFLAWSGFGTELQAKEKLNQAINDYQAAAEINPDHFVVNFYLTSANRKLAITTNNLQLENVQQLIEADKYLEIIKGMHSGHPVVVSEEALMLIDKAIYAWQRGDVYQTLIENSKLLLSNALKNHSNNRLLTDNLVLVYLVEQQIQHFSGNYNAESMQRALEVSELRKAFGNQEFILLQLLKNSWQSIAKKEVDKLPINPESILTRAEWYSQAGYFKEAEALFHEIKHYHSYSLIKYQLQHNKRWSQNVVQK